MKEYIVTLILFMIISIVLVIGSDFLFGISIDFSENMGIMLASYALIRVIDLEKEVKDLKSRLDSEK